MKFALIFCCMLYIWTPVHTWGMGEDMSGVMLLQIAPTSPVPLSEPPLSSTFPAASDLLYPQELWYPQGKSPSSQDDLWKKGTAVEDLTSVRKHLLNGATYDTKTQPPTTKVDTERSINARLQELSRYEDSSFGEELNELARGPIRGEFFTDERTWRNPTTEPMKIDESTFVNRREILGAYADMVREENFQVFMGPEFYLPTEESTSPYATHTEAQKSDVGVGMQFQWGF